MSFFFQITFVRHRNRIKIWQVHKARFFPHQESPAERKDEGGKQEEREKGAEDEKWRMRKEGRKEGGKKEKMF